MTVQPNSLLQTVRTSPLVQVLLIGFLALLLQIPIAMINGLIGERRDTRDEVMRDVTGKWGREQTIVGPMLVTVLLLKVSGVSLLEQDLRQTKPGYREYVERTSAFIPWFPRTL